MAILHRLIRCDQHTFVGNSIAQVRGRRELLMGPRLYEVLGFDLLGVQLHALGSD